MKILLGFLLVGIMMTGSVWALDAQHQAEPGVAVRLAKASTDRWQITCRIPEPFCVRQPGTGEEAWRVTLPDMPQAGDIGQPLVPVVPVRVLLPPGQEPADIRVDTGARSTLHGRYLLDHADKAFPLIPEAKPGLTLRDEDAYASPYPYPGRLIDSVGVQVEKGYRVLVINVFPVSYLPLSREVSWFEEVSITITLQPVAERNQALMRVGNAGRLRFAGEVINPDESVSYNRLRAVVPERTGICNATGSCQYVVITGEAFINDSDAYAVTNLLAHRRSQGVTARAVSVEEIESEYTGVDSAEKVRNFIRDAYNNWETEYVLLAGDTNVVPMRKLWCEAGGTTDHLPSDLYFQCLDGSYNEDGDDRWGEPTDGNGGGDVDLVAEVYIGRASAETPAELSHFIYKVIQYETVGDAAYLRRALICGEELGSQFGPDEFSYAMPYMEEIRWGTNTAGYATEGFASCPHFVVDTMYEYDAPWVKTNILAMMNQGLYGVINHLGHANYNYVMKFYNADADALTNTQFFFAYSQGCIPGNFEEDCVGEHLTTTHRHGAFGVVFNSRYGWGAYNDSYATLDGPSQRFDRQFWDAYFGERLLHLGELNADSHEDNIWDINGNYIRWCYYESNLLGDPRTPLRGRFVNGMISISPLKGLEASGGEGGPFQPASRSYTLYCSTTSGPLQWAVASTQSWVSFSVTNGTMNDGDLLNLTVSINTNAEGLAEGTYRDTLIFTNLTTGLGATNFPIELTVNNPPVVTNCTVQQGGIQTAGVWSCEVMFNEAMQAPSELSFALTGTISGAHAPSSWNYTASPSLLSLSYTNLPDDAYVLTLRSAADAFVDVQGGLLDGEASAWPIGPNASGNGAAGGDFLVSFQLDAEQIPYPLPLEAKEPFGSLVYDPAVEAYVATTADEDEFTLAVDSGQTFTVYADADELQSRVRLYAPGGVTLGDASAVSNGGAVIVQTAPVDVSGVYTVNVSGVGSSTGLYEVAVWLNAALEEEGRMSADNDSRANAQALDDAFISLPGGMQRAAVLGFAEAGALTRSWVDDFESGLEDYTVDNDYGSGNGLWHRSSGRSADAGHSASWSLYYGQHEDAAGGGDYDTETVNGGAVYSDWFTVPEGGAPYVALNYFLESEGGLYWDIATLAVEVGDDERTLLTSGQGSLPNTDGAWSELSADLSAWGGETVRLRFDFDTEDASMNDYEGWYLDDVSLWAYGEGAADYYNVSLEVGECPGVYLVPSSGGGLSLTVENSAGTTCATGCVDQASGYTVLDGWTVPQTGLYYLRVAGRGDEYSLLILRNGRFAGTADTLDGDVLAMGCATNVLGAIDCPLPVLSQEEEPNDDGQVGFAIDDLAYANALDGSFVDLGSGVYTAVITGVISAGNDEDWDFFRFIAGPGDTVTIALNGHTLSDTYLRMYDAEGVLLESDDDGGDGLYSLIEYMFTESGDYYVVADSFGSYSGSYQLDMGLTSSNRAAVEDSDCIRIEGAAGDVLHAQTWTPGDGPLLFTNQLVPEILLYDGDGILLTNDVRSAADGRNAQLSCLLMRNAAYDLVVRAAEHYGEYAITFEHEAGTPLITFEEPVSFAEEDSGWCHIPVVLTAPVGVSFSVDYHVQGGSAAAGTDYVLSDGTLAFDAGVVSTDIVVYLNSDAAVEGTETLELVLTNQTYSLLGEYREHELVIVDSDNPQRVAFSQASYTVAETTAVATLTVERHGGSNGPVCVAYSTDDGTAKAGMDYSTVTGLLCLADGEAEQTITVPLVFDMLIEGDETFRVCLGETSQGLSRADPSMAIVTINDFEYAQTNCLDNPDMETALSNSWWYSQGNLYQADWAARSGTQGVYVEGWVPYSYGYLYQYVPVERGTYTYSIWARRESGYLAVQFYLRIEWLDDGFSQIQDPTHAYFTSMPGDGGWHPLHVTGTCDDPRLARVRVSLYTYWGNRITDPSALMFDDAAFYAGSYTGQTTLANTGFEEGVNSDWRGSSWYASPEKVSNTREDWPDPHSGSWIAALYGWETNPVHYSTRIEQNLVPGPGVYTFGIWALRESNFLLTNAELRLGWYDETFTNLVQAESVTEMNIPADGAWHYYQVSGLCLDTNLFEVRATILSEYQYNSAELPGRALKYDDAFFTEGYPDSDGDGLPDFWEAEFYADPTNALEGADDDGDGFSNWEEYLADSCPTNPASCLEWSQVQHVGDWQLSFSASSQRLYNVWMATNLIGAPWDRLYHRVPGTNSIMTISDTNALPQCIYRIEVLEP